MSGFGIDYNCTEEVFSWDLENHSDTLIHHEGYYCDFGKIEGDEFDFEKFDVKKLPFKKALPFLVIGQGNSFDLY